MDITHLGGIVALIGLVASSAGTIIGAKVAISMLQRAHERFEDAVWKAINIDRDKASKIAERVATMEAICKERAKGDICGP